LKGLGFGSRGKEAVVKAGASFRIDALVNGIITTSAGDRYTLGPVPSDHVEGKHHQLRNAPATPDLVDILLGQARELLQRTDLAGASRAAVVLAHTASEVEAEQTATRLVLGGKTDQDIKVNVVCRSLNDERGISPLRRTS
jgi:hypothetical protein